MELAGTIAENLHAPSSVPGAFAGSVHGDTLRFWQDLLDCARVKASRSPLAQSDEMHRLIADLQSELAARGQAGAAESKSRSDVF